MLIPMLTGRLNAKVNQVVMLIQTLMILMLNGNLDECLSMERTAWSWYCCVVHTWDTFDFLTAQFISQYSCKA